jgi:hypothetical protein
MTRSNGWSRAASTAAVVAALSSPIIAQVRDLDGHRLMPFDPAGKAQVIFFIASDCPISNAYAPEIQRVCRAFEPKGVSCLIAYEDERIDASAVKDHLESFGYRGVPATVDTSRMLAIRARASITPQATVVDAHGQIRYRGRIDNFYAALGKPRQQVTSHELIDALDAVLAGKPVAHPESEPVGCFIPGTKY